MRKKKIRGDPPFSHSLSIVRARRQDGEYGEELLIVLGIEENDFPLLLTGSTCSSLPLPPFVLLRSLVEFGTSTLILPTRTTDTVSSHPLFPPDLQPHSPSFTRLSISTDPLPPPKVRRPPLQHHTRRSLTLPAVFHPFSPLLALQAPHIRPMLRLPLRFLARSALPARRTYASEAGEYQGGPTFELSEEQSAVRELARSFTVRLMATGLHLPLCLLWFVRR
jgi:hypothetical protein